MRLLSLAILLWWSSSMSAQLNGKYSFRHINPSDGLLHSTVNGIGQDQRGFIWILTIGGLQRYDGSRFINYPEIINQSYQYVMDGSTLMLMDKSHGIIVNKLNKVEWLNLDDNKIITYTLPELLRKDSIHPPILFTGDNQERWLIGDFGLWMNGDTDYVKYTLITQNPGNPYTNNTFIKDTINGVEWISQYNKFLIGDLKTKRLYSTSDVKPEHPLLLQLKNRFPDRMALRFITMDSHHNLWIATWTDEILRYNLQTSTLSEYSLKTIKNREDKTGEENLTLLVNVIYEDRQKNIWFGTDNAGLLKYDQRKDDFDFITSDEKTSDGLKYNFRITSIFQDRDDNLWLGTDRGINIFNPYHDRFRAIRHQESDGVATIPRHDINDVIETAQGEILVSTWGGGITIYDQQWNFIRNIRFQGAIQPLTWCLLKADDGKIWIGAQAGFIHIYDPVKKSFETIRPVETEFSTVRKMAKDSEGNILLGLHNGKAIVWKASMNKFYPYDKTSDLSVVPIWAALNVLIDQNNTGWVATDVGLRQFDMQRNVYTGSFPILPDQKDKGVAVQGMEQLNDSMLLLGTNNAGMYLFNAHTHTFSRPSGIDYLNATSVYAVKKDLSGHIWFTTNFNLCRMDQNFTHVIEYNLDQADITAAFGNNQFYTLSDGRWVTSTFSELICFHPSELENVSKESPKVEISSFKVLNEPLYIDSFLLKGKPVILPFNRNFISIEFTVLDFSNKQQTNYYYRLKDVDENWIHTTSKQFADYTALPPGAYVFEVKADIGNGPSPVTSFNLVITPPWWGTWWFRILCLLAVGSMIYFILKSRIHTIRKEAALKHRIAETEMLALRSQMNPHFIFNCINSIDAMIQSNDKYKATVYLNKFAKLIRNVLDSSKQNKIALSKDMETLQLYIDLELFRHQNKFSATVKADEELLQNDYKVPPLIVQPYVENAILHGLHHKMDRHGHLSVVVTRKDEQIVYVIEDNGVGRKQMNGDLSKDNHGYGMQISSDRVRLFNNEEIASVIVTDLEADGLPAGTRVEVKLKI